MMFIQTPTGAMLPTIEDTIRARNDRVAKSLREMFTDEERNEIVQQQYRGAD